MMGDWWTLYHGDKRAAHVRLDFAPISPQVEEFKVISTDDLPVPVRKKSDARFLPASEAFQCWLRLRTMPTDRESLQEILVALFELPEPTKNEGDVIERLRHLSAALTYYQSGFDGFTLVPDETCALPLGVTNASRKTEYVLCHKEPEEIRMESTENEDGLNAFLQHKQDDIPIRSYTLNSTAISGWFGALRTEYRANDLLRADGDMWEVLFERRYFRQYCTESTGKDVIQKRDLLMQYAGRLNFAGKRKLEYDRDLLTNFTDILGGDVVWLSEFADMIEAGTGNCLERMLEVMPSLLGEYNGVAEAIQAMCGLQEKAAENGVVFTLSEFGLALIDEKTVMPVVIL